MLKHQSSFDPHFSFTTQPGLQKFSFQAPRSPTREESEHKTSKLQYFRAINQSAAQERQFQQYEQEQEQQRLLTELHQEEEQQRTLARLQASTTDAPAEACSETKFADASPKKAVSFPMSKKEHKERQQKQAQHQDPRSLARAAAFDSDDEEEEEEAPPTLDRRQSAPVAVSFVVPRSRPMAIPVKRSPPQAKAARRSGFAGSPSLSPPSVTMPNPTFSFDAPFDPLPASRLLSDSPSRSLSASYFPPLLSLVE